MAEFSPAYAKTNAREKMVLSNLATDRGGMTFGGIARGRQPGKQWAGWQLIDRILARSAVLAPTLQEAAYLAELHEAFFRAYFWNDLRGDEIPEQAVAEKVYDAAVNCSRLQAVKWLQAALNVSNLGGRLWADVTMDGQIGPETCRCIRAAVSRPERQWLVLQVIETQQEDHYFQLALRDATQESNLLGWYRHRILNRVEPPAA